MKRKINIPRVIWVVSLFLLLIIVLLMVMDYKINYQYLTHDYLYFYECSGELCVSNSKDNKKLLYVAYDCGYETCPEYKKSISDDYALLNSGQTYILYNYKKDLVVSKNYDDYEFIDSNYVIVKKGNVYGIMNIDNKEIVTPNYDEIGIHVDSYLTGYNSEVIIAKKNDKYGTISYRDGKLAMEFKYTDETLEELVNSLKTGKQ